MHRSLFHSSALAVVLMLTAGAQAQDAEENSTTQGQEPVVEQPAAQDAPAEQDTDMQAAEEPTEETETADQSAGGADFLTTQDDQEYRAASVIGVDVINAANDTIGEIDDIILDADDKVVGVLVSVGGFLGIGEKWVGLPIDQVEFGEEEETARAEYTSEQLESAPDFATKEDQEAEEQARQAQQDMMSREPQPAVPAAESESEAPAQ